MKTKVNEVFPAAFAQTSFFRLSQKFRVARPEIFELVRKMYKANNFKVNEGEEIDLDDDSQEVSADVRRKWSKRHSNVFQQILVTDAKGTSKLAFKISDETDSKTSAADASPASGS